MQLINSQQNPATEDDMSRQEGLTSHMAFASLQLQVFSKKRTKSRNEGVASLGSKEALGKEATPQNLLFIDTQSLKDVTAEERQKWRIAGLECIAHSHTAAVILAGGIGSRLSIHDGASTAMIDHDLLSRKSIFHLLSERVLRVQQLAKKSISSSTSPTIFIIVVTNNRNHTSIQEFFRSNANFGLESSQIRFVCQPSSPCLNSEGKHITVETFINGGQAKDGSVLQKKRLAEAPIGTAGLLACLRDNSCASTPSTKALLAELEARNIKALNVISGNNLLGKISDPVAIGYLLSEPDKAVIKVVKGGRNPSAILARDSLDSSANLRVCEEIDLTPRQREQIQQFSAIVTFDAGSGFFTLATLKALAAGATERELLDKCQFVRRDVNLAHSPPLSIQQPLPEESSNVTQAAQELSVYIQETHLYSLLKAQQCIFLECNRDEEFAPVINLPMYSIFHSSISGRAMISALHRRWMESAGGDFTAHLLTKGIIQKQGRKLKQWSSRYVVYDGVNNSYVYYRSEKEHAVGRPPKGHFTITDVTAYSNSQRPYGFACMTTAGKRLVCTVASKTEQEYWIRRITNGVDSRARGSRLCEVSPLCSYEGEGLEDLQGKPLSLPFHYTPPVRHRASLTGPSPANVMEILSGHTMKAVTLELEGGQKAFKMRDNVEVPQCGPDDVIIHSLFSGVQRGDGSERKNMSSADAGASKTLIPGVETAGYIYQVGEKVSEGFSENDRVFAFVGNSSSASGTFAEYVKVPSSLVCRVPSGISMAQASAVPALAVAAWQALNLGFQKLSALSKQSKNSKILIYGGGSRLGFYMIQMAKSLGCFVFAADSSECAGRMKRCGADLVIDSQRQNVIEIVRVIGEQEGAGVEIVFDLMGTDDSTAQSEKILEPRKGIYVDCSWDRPSPLSSLSEEPSSGSPGIIRCKLDPKPSGEDLKEIARLIDLKRVVPLPVAVEKPLKEAAEALSMLEKDAELKGKGAVVLRVRSAEISSDLRAKYIAAGQQSVFKYADAGCLAPGELDALEEQLQAIDLQTLQSNLGKSSLSVERVERVKQDYISLDDCQTLPHDEETQSLGLQAIAHGKVAIITTTSSDYEILELSTPPETSPASEGSHSHVHDVIPNLYLPSRKSTFQLFAERILRLQFLASAQADSGLLEACTKPSAYDLNGTNGNAENGKALSPSEARAPWTVKRIQWYIITTQANDSVIRKLFFDRNYFGLDMNQVVFLMEAISPRLSIDGKILMESGTTVSQGSLGSGGGLIESMKKARVLSDLEANGVAFVHCCSIYNALCKVADPAFIGYVSQKERDVEAGVKLALQETPADAYPQLGKVVTTKEKDRLRISYAAAGDRAQETSVLSDMSEYLLSMYEQNTNCKICLLAAIPPSSILLTNPQALFKLYYLWNLPELFRKLLTEVTIEYQMVSKALPYADGKGQTKISNVVNGSQLYVGLLDTIFQSLSRPAVALCRVPAASELAWTYQHDGDTFQSRGISQRFSDLHRKWLMRSLNKKSVADSWSNEEAQKSSISDGVAESVIEATALDAQVLQTLRHAERVEISPLVSYAGEGLQGTLGRHAIIYGADSIHIAAGSSHSTARS